MTVKKQSELGAILKS